MALHLVRLSVVRSVGLNRISGWFSAGTVKLATLLAGLDDEQRQVLSLPTNVRNWSALAAMPIRLNPLNSLPISIESLIGSG